MASEKCKKAACPTVCSIIGLCLIIAATTIIALGTVEKLVKMMVNSVSDIIKKNNTVSYMFFYEVFRK